MSQLNRQKAFGMMRRETQDTKKSELLSQFQKEQQKLEDMVAARFENGTVNLGTDVRVLNQSRLIDSLIVDRMKLEEIEAKYNN